MTDRLGDQYGLQNESLALLAGVDDPAYSARIYLPGETITFHVSLLGPYYGIHQLGEREEPGAIARAIEVTYPGYVQIPPEIGNYVVPDVDVPARMFGESTIYVCLFSVVWEWGAEREPAP